MTPDVMLCIYYLLFIIGFGVLIQGHKPELVPTTNTPEDPMPEHPPKLRRAKGIYVSKTDEDSGDETEPYSFDSDNESDDESDVDSDVVEPSSSVDLGETLYVRQKRGQCVSECELRKRHQRHVQEGVQRLLVTTGVTPVPGV